MIAKYFAGVVFGLAVSVFLGAVDSVRAPRPSLDTGSVSSTGPVGEAFMPTAVSDTGVLPSDVNVTHNLTVGNDLLVDGIVYARGSIGAPGFETTFAGLVNAAAAGLILPVASAVPAVSHDGAIVTIGGLLYQYDATRSAWLSVDREQVWFGRAGSVTNAYLNGMDTISSKTAGYPLLRDATVTGLTVTARGNVWYVASVGGDFSNLQTALASPLVVNGDVIKMAPETFITPAQITINKSVTIEGCGAGPIIRTAGTAADPTHVLYITVGNVALVNIDVEQRKTTNTSVESAITVQAPGATGIRLSGTTSITTMEFGLIVRAAEFTIEDCDFRYQGSAGNNHRFIMVYGNAGNSRIVDNVFTPSSDAPTARTVFCLLTAGGGDTYSGSLVVSGNTQSGGNLRQFLTQESFAGAAGSFGLYVTDNTYNDLNGGVSLYSGAPNLLNLFSSIVLARNTVSNAHGRGLLVVDGTGPGPWAAGTTTWYIDGNQLANPAITAPGWANACTIPGIVGYNTSIYAPFSIVFSSVIPAPPAILPAFTVDIRKNGCPESLATVPVYGTDAQVTNINLSCDQGDRLQTYILGTAQNPVVGLEYAYDAS